MKYFLPLIFILHSIKSQYPCIAHKLKKDEIKKKKNLGLGALLLLKLLWVWLSHTALRVLWAYHKTLWLLFIIWKHNNNKSKEKILLHILCCFLPSKDNCLSSFIKRTTYINWKLHPNWKWELLFFTNDNNRHINILSENLTDLQTSRSSTVCYEKALRKAISQDIKSYVLPVPASLESPAKGGCWCLLLIHVYSELNHCWTTFSVSVHLNCTCLDWVFDCPSVC